jgi:hypothetical protein
VHRFDQIYRANGIEHRLTKPNHPWPNGQVERMNRTIKEATVNPLPLRDSRPTPSAPGRLRNGLQLRPSAQNTKGPHALRSRLQSLDHRAPLLHLISDPSKSGTKHDFDTDRGDRTLQDLGHHLLLFIWCLRPAYVLTGAREHGRTIPLADLADGLRSIYLSAQDSWSSSALASLRSGVSNPSVNHA